MHGWDGEGGGGGFLCGLGIFGVKFLSQIYHFKNIQNYIYNFSQLAKNESKWHQDLISKFNLIHHLNHETLNLVTLWCCCFSEMEH